MQQTDALKIVGYLAGLSQGWTDDSIAMYALEVEALADYDSALAAAQSVMRSWKETRRPPLALIVEAYRLERNRRDSEVRQFAVGRGSTVPISEGLGIAWLGYESECAKQGRKPNRAMFAGWAKRVGA
jgi:hypothetical protein